MKMLQGGQPWSMKVECTHCHGLLEVKEADLKNDLQFEGEQGRSIHVVCVSCGGRTFIHEQSIPPHVRQRVDKKK